MSEGVGCKKVAPLKSSKAIRLADFFHQHILVTKQVSANRNIRHLGLFGAFGVIIMSLPSEFGGFMLVTTSARPLYLWWISLLIITNCCTCSLTRRGLSSRPVTGL